MGQWRRAAMASELMKMRKLDEICVHQQNIQNALTCCLWLLVTAWTQVRKQSGLIRERACKSWFISSAFYETSKQSETKKNYKNKKTQSVTWVSNHSVSCYFKHIPKQTHSYFSFNTCGCKHTHKHLWCFLVCFKLPLTLSLKRAVLVCWRNYSRSTMVCVCVCVCVQQKARGSVCVCVHMHVHVGVRTHVCLCAWLWKDRGSFNHFNSDHREVKKQGGGRFDVSSQQLTNTEWDKAVTVIRRAGHSGDQCVCVCVCVCVCKTEGETERERVWQ